MILFYDVRDSNGITLLHCKYPFIKMSLKYLTFTLLNGFAFNIVFFTQQFISLVHMLYCHFVYTYIGKQKVL